MKYFPLIFGLLFSFPVFSQILKGRITDTVGNPIPVASVYVKENKQSLIANHAGEFQTKLPIGIYHIEVSCMGYESETREIRIDNQDLELVVELKEKYFQLKEVEVQWKEDPAYEIMRNAIKMAPYYQSVVKKTTYEVYSKGSGKIVHIPSLVNSISKGDLEKFRDKLFMQESFSEIKFTAPDKYEQNIKAYSNTFPNMDDPQDALGITMISLYNPIYRKAVSPLNPKAFDYYRFRYEGYEKENGQIVNKIRIIPKLKDHQLLEGIIYIADDEWNIRHAEITCFPIGMTQHITLNYHPVVDNIYLVTTYESKLDINLMGMKLDANFLYSIQYTDIQLNDSLISAREKTNLSNKKKEKKGLEIKREDLFKKDMDSLAVKRDSLYWSEIRTVVLNEEELKSYARKDTIQALVDSIQGKDNPPFKMSDLLKGGRLGNNSAFVRFSYSGLLFAFPEYNFVDGVWMGQFFDFDFKQKKNTGFKLNTAFHWASARQTLLWKTELFFDYAPRRLGQLNLSVGRESADFSGETGMSRLLNSIYSLCGANNYTKFYDKNYGRLSNQIDLTNGLQLDLGIESEKRQSLENTTTWNLFGTKNKWTPNIPEYSRDLNMKYNILHKYNVSLKYTPEYYYRINEGKKQYVRSRFPTFELDYQRGFRFLDGFPLNDDKPSSFQRLELSAKQEVKLGIFKRLNYTFVAGKYLNDNPFNYIDYKHFNIGGPWLAFKDWKDSYTLLPYYTYSTNKEWIQAFVNYDTDYLLLKRLPFLQGKLFTETVQAKFLHTPDKKYYSEWGYSVNLPYGLGGAGVFVAFDSFDYQSVGLQFSIPLFGLIGKRTEEITISVGN